MYCSLLFLLLLFVVVVVVVVVVFLFCFVFLVSFVLFFTKLVLLRFLAWFSISLTYLNLYTCNFLLCISPRLYRHFLHFLLYPNIAQCHFLFT